LRIFRASSTLKLYNFQRLKIEANVAREKSFLKMYGMGRWPAGPAAMISNIVVATFSSIVIFEA